MLRRIKEKIRTELLIEISAEEKDYSQLTHFLSASIYPLLATAPKLLTTYGESSLSDYLSIILHALEMCKTLDSELFNKYIKALTTIINKFEEEGNSIIKKLFDELVN